MIDICLGWFCVLDLIVYVIDVLVWLGVLGGLMSMGGVSFLAEVLVIMVLRLGVCGLVIICIIVV